MTKQQRVRYEMYLRVKDFGIANGEMFPKGSSGERAFSVLAEGVAQIDAHIQTRPVGAKDSLKERGQAREAVVEAMRKIARTAKGRERVPGQPNTLATPRGASNVAVVQAGEAFIREAEAVKDELVELGLSASAVDDLRQKVHALVCTMRGGRTSRRGRASADGNLEAAFRLVSQALRKLDIVVPNVVEANPGLVAGWKRDRAVVGGRSYKRTPPVPASPDMAAPSAGDPVGPIVKAS